MVLSRKKIKRNNKIFSQRISTYKKNSSKWYLCGWLLGLPGKNPERLALEKADQLELALNWGGFLLNRVTFTKRDPPGNLSADDCSVNVAGMKCFS